MSKRILGKSLLCLFVGALIIGAAGSEVNCPVFDTNPYEPKVTILQPDDGESFDEGAPIELRALVENMYGQAQSFVTVAWKSDKDGDLGSAACNQDWESRIELTGLSLGEHTITAVAYNPDAIISAEDSIQVTIRGGGDMVTIPAGTFTMGRANSGDDATYGESDELPRHEVYLDSYQIGKYEVTNAEYTNILNWALGNGYIETYDATTVTSYGQELIDLDTAYCQVRYSEERFIVESRDSYSMEDHPVVAVSWYGAIAYCNWLSRANDLVPCYNTSTWRCDFTRNGYRLPTEAEWERAAAWSGSKHWIYGYQNDYFSQTRANSNDEEYANPLNLSAYPYTTPIGYYNGMNSGTSNSPSPVGCYDMSGNVTEWCYDWYDGNYYNQSPENNPTGPTSDSYRILRGGAWVSSFHHYARSANRLANYPTYSHNYVGFRLSRDN
ncbi:formylglycine-generating enzyme family protein [Candidatus Hydrogenedentota bacterium]